MVNGVGVWFVRFFLECTRHGEGLRVRLGWRRHCWGSWRCCDWRRLWQWRPWRGGDGRCAFCWSPFADWGAPAFGNNVCHLCTRILQNRWMRSLCSVVQIAAWWCGSKCRSVPSLAWRGRWFGLNKQSDSSRFPLVPMYRRHSSRARCSIGCLSWSAQCSACRLTGDGWTLLWFRLPAWCCACACCCQRFCQPVQRILLPLEFERFSRCRVQSFFLQQPWCIPCPVGCFCLCWRQLRRWPYYYRSRQNTVNAEWRVRFRSRWWKDGTVVSFCLCMENNTSGPSRFCSVVCRWAWCL